LEVDATTLITLICALLGLWIAALNLWLYGVRPRERSHLWLAFASAGMVCEAVAIAVLYRAHTLAEAQHAQIAAVAGGIPMVVGLLRFTRAFLHLETPRFWRAYEAYVGLSVVLLCTVRSAMFTGETATVEPGRFAQPFVRAELTGFALVLIATFVPLTARIGFLFVRHHRRRIERGSRSLIVALALSTVFVVNDIAVMSGLWDGILLAHLGLCGFGVAFTGLLLQRASTAMQRVGADAEALQREASRRAEQLRERDLQLAHGARLAAMGSLAGGIARELDEPISFVGNQLNQIAGTWPDVDDTEFSRSMQQSRDQIERVRRIVAELLHLSRCAEGPDEPVDLKPLVETVLAIAGPEARSRAHLDAQLADVPLVDGEARLLTQIVLNLVVTALEAIPPGDPDRYQVVIGTALDRDRVQLTVQHNGPAMAPGQLPELFDATTADRDISTAGFGLTVARKLVARHRGRLDIDSGPSATRFCVTLPVSTAVAA